MSPGRAGLDATARPRSRGLLHLRLIVPPLLALVAVITLFVSALAHTGSGRTQPAPPQLHGPLMPPRMAAPGFTLRDQNGRVATLAQYRGRVVVVSFMYSRCQTACPLMATEIRGALDELPKAGRNVPVLAITVDPTHDTAPSARRFLAREQMTGRMRFLLGSRRRLAPIWKYYGVQPLTRSDEHTAFVFLIDRRGLLRVGYPADQLVPEDLAHDLRLLLAGRAPVPAQRASRPQAVLHAAPDLPGADRRGPRFLAHAARVPYGGGPVLHANRTHLIFWQPSGSGLTFQPGYEAVIETFLSNVAAASHRAPSVYGLTGQYRDATGRAAYSSTYAGALIDTDPLPANGCREPPPPPDGDGPGWTVCLNDAQLESEIAHVISTRRLPRHGNNIYLLVTPDGFGSCGESGPANCALGGSSSGYCAYHSATADETLYAVIPYNAISGHCQSDNPRPNSSTADPTLNSLSEEQIETITDPFGNAWIDSSGNELGDVCSTTYGPDLNGSSGATAYDQVIDGGHYMLHELWSNEDRSCRPRDEQDPITALVPASVLGDRWVRLSSLARDPDGRILRYDWSLGDGGQARGRRIVHAFTRTGRLTITTRSVDADGNYAFAKRMLTVLRPPQPVVRFTRRPKGGSAPRGAVFSVTSTAAIATFQCRIDGGAWLPCRSTFAPPRLSPGTHVLRVRARDTFGQLSSKPARYVFTV